VNPLAWLLAWLMLSSSLGKGGVARRLHLKGHDGAPYDFTFYRDNTIYVSTAKARFWVRGDQKSKPIKIVFGSPQAVRAAIENYPE
jgi:hypothetical protein